MGPSIPTLTWSIWGHAIWKESENFRRMFLKVTLQTMAVKLIVVHVVWGTSIHEILRRSCTDTANAVCIKMTSVVQRPNSDFQKEQMKGTIWGWSVPILICSWLVWANTKQSKVVFHWGCLSLRSFPLRFSLTEGVFHWSLPLMLSTDVVFISYCLILRSSSTRVNLLM